MQAYRAITKVQNDQIHFSSGAVLLLGSVSNAPFATRLTNASIADQLSQSYPLDFKAPKQYQDAGRLRNDEFFINMYGGTSSAVSGQLVKVYWQPAKKNLSFTKVNGAANQLKKSGMKLPKILC